MPKKDKIKIDKVVASKKSKPEMEIVLSKDDNNRIRCCMCGKLKIKAKGAVSSFYSSDSVIYKGNGGYIPVCKPCMKMLYDAYRKSLGSDREAAKRICMKFDVYWSEKMFDQVMDMAEADFNMGYYFKKMHISIYQGRTYDTYLDEESEAIYQQVQFSKSKTAMLEEDYEVSPEQVVVWGAGLDPLFYAELDAKYTYWTEDLDEETIDKATETLIRQICVLQVTQSREAAAGRPIEKLTKSIDSLIGSLNLKPVQKKQVDKNAIDEATEKTPFGVWIRKIEDERPIPEPDESLEDVDSLREYLQTWFLGGLCNMMRIPNDWSELFERAMEQFTVEKPEYDFEDDYTSLDDILEKAEEEGKKAEELGDG